MRKKSPCVIKKHTVFIPLHAHCAWTTPGKSPWFKPIVMDLVWVDQILTNPYPLSPIDTIETCGYCWAWNCLCYSTFCTTTVSQNGKITWNTPNSECMQSTEKEGCTSIWAWACKRMNKVYTNKTDTFCVNTNSSIKWTQFLVVNGIFTKNSLCVCFIYSTACIASSAGQLPNK